MKAETDSINNHSSIALHNIEDIKSQADIHVRRIEKVSDIGQSLTNDINSARGQVEKLLEQLKSLQASLSMLTEKPNLPFSNVIFRLFHANQYHTSRRS